MKVMVQSANKIVIMPETGSDIALLSIWKDHDILLLPPISERQESLTIQFQPKIDVQLTPEQIDDIRKAMGTR